MAMQGFVARNGATCTDFHDIYQYISLELRNSSNDNACGYKKRWPIKLCMTFEMQYFQPNF